MPNIRVTNIGENSATGVIEDLLYTASYYNLFEIEVWNYSESVFHYTESWTDSSASRNYSSETITGLSEGTGYTFKAFVRTSSGRTFVGRYSFYTDESLPPPDTPSDFWVSSQDSNSVNLKWYSSYGADSYSIEVYYQGTSSLVDWYYGLTGTSKYIGGLDAGESYSFKLWAKNDSGNSSPIWTSADIGYPRPDDWYWYTTKSSGADFRLTASEWNAFCNRINDFRQYENLSGRSFTSAYSGGTFYASIFNDARSAIANMSPPNSVPYSVSSGDNVGAYMLNALRDSLNSIR